MRAALLALLLCLPLATASLVPSLGAAPPTAAPAPAPEAPTPLGLLADPAFGPVLRETPGFRALARMQAQGVAPPQAGETAASDLGADGLQLAWLQAFFGTPAVLRAVDLDGDGGRDVVVGTDTGVVAVDGATWAVRWARPIGSPVVGLEVDASAKPARVAVATAHGGRVSEAYVLGAKDGAVAWRAEVLGGATGLALAGSDLLVATQSGAVRLAGADGAESWSAAPVLVPDTGAIVAGHLNYGFYLSAFGDLTGDGVPDVAVARQAYASASAVLVGVRSQRVDVHAIDGATGAALWVHPVGGEGSTYAVTVATDLDLLDTRGDGTLDVAVAGITMRYNSAVVAATPVFYEAFVRVLDGTTATGLALPLGSRGTVSPVLPIELFTHLDHTDAGAGTGDEVAIVRYSVVNSVLGSAYTMERYAMPDEGSGAMVLVSDVAIPVGAVLDLAAPDPAATGARDLLALGSDTVRVTAAGAESGRRDLGTAAARAALALGDTFVLGTNEGLLVTGGDLQATTAEVPFHGSVRQVERAGVGPGGLVVVWSTDGAVHVLDGVTGARLARHEAVGLTAVHATGNQTIVRRSDNGTLLEAWSLVSGAVLWSTKLENPRGLAWFDGNDDGVDDVLAEFEFSDYVLRAVNGATGATLWTSKLESSISSIAAGFALRRAGSDDLVLGYYGDLFQFDGATGKLLWSLPNGPWPYCTGVVDAIDPKPAVGVRIEGKLVVRAYARDGKPTDVATGLDTFACVLLPVTGGFMLASSFWDGEQYVAEVARFAGADKAWSVRAADTALVALLEDAASDRLYVRDGDRLQVRSLATGALRGELELGMALRQAVAHDLDGNGTLDLLVATPDGLLRAAGRGLRLPEGRAATDLAAPDVLADGVLTTGESGLPAAGPADGRSAPGAGEAAAAEAAPAPDAIIAALALTVAVLSSRRKAGRLLRTD